MCKISIVMPVYNKEKYIARGIHSILVQTFKDWELIIIDDGSTDCSLNQCKKFRDSRIQVFHTLNRGVSEARNLGISKATGEYITFIDSDDFVAENYLEKIYRPDEEMVIGGVAKVDINGKVIERICPYLDGNVYIEDMAKTFYKEQLATGIYGFVSSKLIKKSVIEKNKIRFDSKINLAEDYDFFLKIYGCIEQVWFTDYTGYYYEQETINSAITMDDNKIDFFEQINIQKKTKSFLRKNHSFGEWEEKQYNQIISNYAYTILMMSATKGKKIYSNNFNRLKKEHIVYLGEGGKAMQIIMSGYNRGLTSGTYVVLRLKKAIRNVLKGER